METIPLAPCGLSSFGECGAQDSRPLSPESLSPGTRALEDRFPPDWAGPQAFALTPLHTLDKGFTRFGSKTDKRLERQRWVSGSQQAEALSGEGGEGLCASGRSSEGAAKKDLQHLRGSRWVWG